MAKLITKPYESRVREHREITSIPAKVYVMDLLGRDPVIYEWGNTGRKLLDVLETLERALGSSPHVGVPHVITALPHFTRCFRFGDPRAEESETNVYHVALWDTNQLAAGTAEPLNREAVGCLGELDVIAEESKIWALSKSVEEYLETYAPIPIIKVIQNKLGGLVSS